MLNQLHRKDLDRAVIVGEETYGKASAQQIVKLGPRDIVRLTTSFLLSPSGRSISKFSSPQHQTEVGGQFTTLHRRPVSEGSGVQPDVQVKANKGGRVGDLLTLRGVYFDFASLYVERFRALPLVTCLQGGVINMETLWQGALNRPLRPTSCLLLAASCHPDPRVISS
eukprot:765400-Hanusia_phi.AAC.3